jgi:hypothetical protein
VFLPAPVHGQDGHATKTVNLHHCLKA